MNERKRGRKEIAAELCFCYIRIIAFTTLNGPILSGSRQLQYSTFRAKTTDFQFFFIYFFFFSTERNGTNNCISKLKATIVDGATAVSLLFSEQYTMIHKIYSKHTRLTRVDFSDSGTFNLQECYLCISFIRVWVDERT